MRVIWCIRCRRIEEGLEVFVSRRERRPKARVARVLERTPVRVVQVVQPVEVLDAH